MVDLSSQYEKIKPSIDKAILEVIGNAHFINGPEVTSFQKDLAKKQEQITDTNNENNKVDFKSENFTDTFEHFSDNNNEEGIEAWDGNDFSYL